MTDEHKHARIELGLNIARLENSLKAHQEKRDQLTKQIDDIDGQMRSLEERITQLRHSLNFMASLKPVEAPTAALLPGQGPIPCSVCISKDTCKLTDTCLKIAYRQ